MLFRYKYILKCQTSRISELLCVINTRNLLLIKYVISDVNTFIYGYTKRILWRKFIYFFFLSGLSFLKSQWSAVTIFIDLQRVKNKVYKIDPFQKKKKKKAINMLETFVH